MVLDSIGVFDNQNNYSKPSVIHTQLLGIILLIIP